MSQSGTFQSGEILDISLIYEMSIFTNAILGVNSPFPKIMCSNDGLTWCEYSEMTKSYMYLADLMANKIKVDCNENLTFHYNANLKR